MKEQHGGGRWDWTHPSGARLIIDEITPKGDTLRAWIQIRHGTTRKVVGSYDLKGARTVGALAKDAATTMPSLKVDWRDMILTSILQIIDHHLEGDDIIPLSEVTIAKGQRWLLQPLVSSTGVTSLIGWGGSLKSVLALAAAATVASGDSRYLGITPTTTGTVLYLDWEADSETHHERLAGLCRGIGVDMPTNVLYRQEAVPLHRSANALERKVAALGVRFVVVDSVMMARGGDAMGPEETVPEGGCYLRYHVEQHTLDGRGSY